jgi:hypothetical protein
VCIYYNSKTHDTHDQHKVRFMRACASLEMDDEYILTSSYN